LLGGANTRFALAKAQRRFDERQNFIFLPFVQRVYVYVIAKGIANGDLPFDPNWFRALFHRPAKMTVDVGREATANREDVWAGLRTPQEDYEERGCNFLMARDDLENSARDLLNRADKLVKEFSFLDHAGAIALLEKRGGPQIVLEAPKPAPAPKFTN
jgi:capsid protein